MVKTKVQSLINPIFNSYGLDVKTIGISQKVLNILDSNKIEELNEDIQKKLQNREIYLLMPNGEKKQILFKVSRLISQEGQQVKCECGEPLDPSYKFCMNCGKQLHRLYG